MDRQRQTYGSDTDTWASIDIYVRRHGHIDGSRQTHWEEK